MLLFPSVSCGAKDDYYISPYLASYVELFESTYSVKVDFDVVVSDLDPQYVGMCTTWSDGSKKIEISAKYLSLMHKSLIEETVFHELGHCFFNREHDDSFIRIGGSWMPKSIMYSYIHPNHTSYEQNRDWYYRELLDPNAVSN